MSNLFSTVGNYSGRQPNNTQSVKQFVASIRSYVNWIYKNNGTIITPSTDTDVLIPKNLYVNGSLFNPSDVRLKQDIKKIDDNFANNLISIEPVQFKYNNDTKVHYGFIAQNVETFYPELVMSIQSDYKAVNYTEFIPILLKKIQSLEIEVNDLKVKLDKNK